MQSICLCVTDHSYAQHSTLITAMEVDPSSRTTSDIASELPGKTLFTHTIVFLLCGNRSNKT